MEENDPLGRALLSSYYDLALMVLSPISFHLAYKYLGLLAGCFSSILVFLFVYMFEKKFSAAGFLNSRLNSFVYGAFYFSLIPLFEYHVNYGFDSVIPFLVWMTVYSVVFTALRYGVLTRKR